MESKNATQVTKIIDDVRFHEVLLGPNRRVAFAANAKDDSPRWTMKTRLVHEGGDGIRRTESAYAMLAPSMLRGRGESR